MPPVAAMLWMQQPGADHIPSSLPVKKAREASARNLSPEADAVSVSPRESPRPWSTQLPTEEGPCATAMDLAIEAQVFEFSTGRAHKAGTEQKRHPRSWSPPFPAGHLWEGIRIAPGWIALCNTVGVCWWIASAVRVV